MSRFATERRTFFVEEPLFSDTGSHLEVRGIRDALFLVVPHIARGLSPHDARATEKRLFDELLAKRAIRDYVLWYSTPMALDFTRHAHPSVAVYDCMDELSAFHGAPQELRERERELFARVDVVFTGGESLYEAKKSAHPFVHAVPSSVDANHFASARTGLVDPDDQAAIPHPRAGFFGVIDERMDCALLERVADARPDLHLVMIGPVVKIDPATLPQRPNIHYLGSKSYDVLPAYVAGWEVALMPFAVNASTRFISPTKTLEYLAAGKPVVSTAIRDVVSPYGELGLVRIADHGSFVAAIGAALTEEPTARRAAADAFVARTSWDRTWARVSRLMSEAMARVATRKSGLAVDIVTATRAATAAE
jgi:UDP-galactopyranose mutase